MKKIFLIITALVLIASMTACGPKAKESGEMTQGEINKVNEDNVQSAEDDEIANTDMLNDMAVASGGGSVEGLPDGFPQSVPFFDGAQLIEADTYGDNGFTVVYAVNAPYESVVAFYMQTINGLDESGIGDDEAYFEGVDIEGGVHINGLTISDADGTTQVFITLKAGAGDAAVSDGAFADNSYDDEESEENEIIQADFGSVEGINLEDGYPEDVVPLYDAFKIIESSKAPSRDLYMLDGITPPDSYDDVVTFYSNALGISPESFDSQMMKTDDFSGEKDGWSYTVYVGVMKAGGNVMINITMKK